MASVSSEEWTEERRRSHTVSAGISELESCNGDEVDDGGGAFSSARFSPVRASSSLSLRPTFSFCSIGKKDEVVLADNPIGEKNEAVWDDERLKSGSDLSEIDTNMMKERFAKLLLGEDMSGGGKGVCSALAISNAITNLAASVFGALWKLEPLAPQMKAMWLREMEWLLSISDAIVELVPSVHQLPGGGTYEIMATRPRSDLYINLQALKKLDAMLISILDEFQDKEFCYDDGRIVVDDNKCSSVMFSERPSGKQEGKWWLPWPKIPRKGLSEGSRKLLQQFRNSGNQILKAALAINSNALAEMDIPIAYLENLAKSGRECVGDTIYNSIAADQFEPELLLDSLQLSSDHQVLDVANKLEAAMHLWKQKERKKRLDTQKAKQRTWSGKMKGFVADGEKNQILAERAETLLQYLRLRFPNMPQTALEMSKIQYNKVDVGHAILESYSRVMESLAFNIIARIDDVLQVDDSTKRSAVAEALSSFIRGGGFNGLPIQKKILRSPFSLQPSPYVSPFDTPFISSTPLPSSPRSFTVNDESDGQECLSINPLILDLSI